MKGTSKMRVEFDESLFNNAEDAAAFHAWKRRKRRDPSRFARELISLIRICARQLGCDGDRRRSANGVRARQLAMRTVRVRRNRAISARLGAFATSFVCVCVGWRRECGGERRKGAKKRIRSEKRL